MEESRTDAVPGTPYPAPGTGRPAAPDPAACGGSARRRVSWSGQPKWGERVFWDEPAGWEEPSERAYPMLVLTPVPEPRAPREPWAGGVHIVSALAVLVIAAELGRRAGAPARLAGVCSAAGFAVVLVPRLVSAAPRPRLRLRHRHRRAAAIAAR